MCVAGHVFTGVKACLLAVKTLKSFVVGLCLVEKQGAGLAVNAYMEQLCRYHLQEGILLCRVAFTFYNKLLYVLVYTSIPLGLSTQDFDLMPQGYFFDHQVLFLSFPSSLPSVCPRQSSSHLTSV